MDDGRIVDLFLARDEQALAEARAKYGGRLFSLARNLLGDPETALECVSDALFEAWNRIPPHEPREYLFAFLAKLTRASALTRVRARSAAKRSAELVELTGELEALIPSPSDTESEAEARRLRSVMNAFLRSLPDKKRELFVRRYWYCESIEAIAAARGTSQSQVKSALFRIRKQLKAYLEKEGFSL